MKLQCRALGNKKVLVIPAIYWDMFDDGETYDGLKCIRTARYKCLLVPSYRWDEFEEGEEYEIRVPGRQVHRNPLM